MSNERIYLPSAAEISAACREIQKEWSDKEWNARSVVDGGHWLPPGIVGRCRIQATLKKNPG